MVFWKKLTTNDNKQQTPEVRAISAAKTDVDADAAAELSNNENQYVRVMPERK